MLIKRQIIEKIREFDKSILLVGPRQVGKSTLLASMHPEITINLADQNTFLEFLKDPDLLRKTVRGHQRIFIDEVQRIPSLLNTVQALVDHDKNLRFLLSGSSARKLKRGHANLLPGRMLLFRLGPLSMEELPPDVPLDRLLSTGALPGIITEENLELSKKLLRTYAATYLKEEVQAEALTRNLEGFSRYFEVIASRSGDFADFTKFSSLAMIERTAARRYFDVLVDTLILESVPAFAKSLKSRLIQHPRFYFFDVGVLNGSLRNFEASADRKGMLFEHLCLQMILSEAKNRDEDIRVSVYRTEGGAEVDFIVERQRETVAIEVKATRTLGNQDTRGLDSFMKFTGGKSSRNRGIIFYLGERNLEVNGFMAVPLKAGIRELFT